MKTPEETMPLDTDKDLAPPRPVRSLLSRFGRRKPATERRAVDTQDEIDERELDKISGGRIHRIDI